MCGKFHTPLRMGRVRVSTVTRAQRAGKIKQMAFSKITKDTFINDCIKAWNLAPSELKNLKCLSGAKASIRKYVLTLPL